MDDDDDGPSVESALRSAVVGQPFIAPPLVTRIMRMAAGIAPSGDGARLAGLTSREREVAELVARGLTNLEIATHLTVSVPTVKTHVARVYAKLGLHTRAALARALYTGSRSPTTRCRCPAHHEIAD